MDIVFSFSRIFSNNSLMLDFPVSSFSDSIPSHLYLYCSVVSIFKPIFYSIFFCNIRNDEQYLRIYLVYSDLLVVGVIEEFPHQVVLLLLRILLFSTYIPCNSVVTYI